MHLSQGTCQALEIFEKKEKEKERVAKEKAEREETATANLKLSGGGDESDPICLSSSPVPQEVRTFFKIRINLVQINQRPENLDHDHHLLNKGSLITAC